MYFKEYFEGPKKDYLNVNFKRFLGIFLGILMEFLKLILRIFRGTINMNVKDYLKDLKWIFRKKFRVIYRVLKIGFSRMF